MKGRMLGLRMNEKRERRGREERIKMVPNFPKFSVSTQGNMKRDVGEFKFKGSAPTAMRWGRPTPRFDRPPLCSSGP